MNSTRQLPMFKQCICSACYYVLQQLYTTTTMRRAQLFHLPPEKKAASCKYIICRKERPNTLKSKVSASADEKYEVFLNVREIVVFMEKLLFSFPFKHKFLI